MDSPEKPAKPKGKFERRRGDISKADAVARAKHFELESLVYEWSITAPELSPRKFLMERKSYTEHMYVHATTLFAPAQWYVRRKEIQDQLTTSLVKTHVDFVVEMNDTHIKAAKLGLVKAIDMMTRMKIEERRDKKGNIYFAGFRTTDLKNCLESIHVAQRIQRMALGLPTNEGSITAWQKIQHEKTVKVSAADGSVVTTTESETVEGQVKTLENALTYDDIQLLIEGERRRKRAPEAAGRAMIDVTPETPNA